MRVRVVPVLSRMLKLGNSPHLDLMQVINLLH